MRLAPFPPLLLALAACSVDNDSANDQMTVQYNQQRIERAARTARDVGHAAGNVAATTGRAIRNEVGDVDVDVDGRRRRRDEAGNSAGAR
jgi:hypothetical protein